MSFPPPPPPGILGLQYQGNNVSSSNGGMSKALASVKKLVDAAQHIVLLSGAGISAESGKYIDLLLCFYLHVYV